MLTVNGTNDFFTRGGRSTQAIGRCILRLVDLFADVPSIVHTGEDVENGVFGTLENIEEEMSQLRELPYNRRSDGQLSRMMDLRS